MNERLAEMRRRAAKRKRERGHQLPKRNKTISSIVKDEERYGGSSFTSFEGGPDENKHHPLFSKGHFLFKILASAILVLVVAILFQKPAGEC